MARQKSAIVVGSGIAGLTAAYELVKTGWGVRVLERNSFPGGRMANVRSGQMLLETGATEVFSFYKDMLALIDELGLSDQLVNADVYRTFHIKNNEREYDFDYGANPLSLLSNGALSATSKLRLLSILPDLMHFRMLVDPCLIDSAVAYDDQDLDSYLAEKVGRDFVDGFIAPIFRLFWRWQPDAFSRAYFFAFIAHTLGSKIFTFRDGIGVLTRTLAARLDVRYNCEVRAISRTHDSLGVRVECVGAGLATVEEADIVVMATEAYRVPKLISDLPDHDRRFFEDVRYTQGMAAHYLLKTDVVPRSTIFAASDPSKLLSYAQVPQGFPGFPGVPSRLWVALTPEYLAANVNQNGTNLDEITRPLVKELYPSLEEDLLEAHMQYEGLQLVLVYPGYIKKLKQFLDGRATSGSPYYFCGDYLAHPHTGGACVSGKRVAKQILERHGMQEH